MVTSNIKATIKKDINKVWEAVTCLDNYSWRSDIKRIQVLDKGKAFIEYTKDDFPTKFTITAFEPMKRYKFDIENNNMTGRWIGLFSYKDGETILDFTEEIHVKKTILKLFVKLYLKKQQATYMKDLRRYLEQDK